MLTPQRAPQLPKNTRLVLDIVGAQVAGDHADAHAIFAAARLRRPGIGVSTVYRALERLSADGLIHAVRVPGAASALYEPARTGHAHFLCTRCGAVADIDYDLPPSAIAALNAAHGVVIAGAALTFSGLCAGCVGSQIAT